MTCSIITSVSWPNMLDLALGYILALTFQQSFVAVDARGTFRYNPSLNK